MKIYLILVLCSLFVTGCQDNVTDMPDTEDDLVKIEPSYLGWDTSKLNELKQFLINKNTKSFMILVDGKIAVEYYLNGHTSSDTWEWNSAGKTLVSAMVGIAQQEGYINIDNRSSDYLGAEWTDMSPEKENLITVKDLLSMTSGINDKKQLIVKSNLTYVADAGSRWAYGNVFQKLIDVVSKASNQNFKTYFEDKIASKLGMKGYWNFGPIFKIYHSDTRSMAKFGLLALNKGKWKGKEIVDEFTKSIHSSQNINPAYGYLWWINGKNSFMLPKSQEIFTGTLISNAPDNMYAALGAKEQRLYVIPSKKMVVIRMGESTNLGGGDLALSSFDNVLWEKINSVIE